MFDEFGFGFSQRFGLITIAISRKYAHKRKMKKIVGYFPNWAVYRKGNKKIVQKS